MLWVLCVEGDFHPRSEVLPPRFLGVSREGLRQATWVMQDASLHLDAYQQAHLCRAGVHWPQRLRQQRPEAAADAGCTSQSMRLSATHDTFTSLNYMHSIMHMHAHLAEVVCQMANSVCMTGYRAGQS